MANYKVKNRAGWIGEIVKIENDSMTVLIGSEEKEYAYPDAFFPDQYGTAFEALDEELATRINHILDEREEAERKKQREIAEQIRKKEEERIAALEEFRKQQNRAAGLCLSCDKGIYSLQDYWPARTFCRIGKKDEEYARAMWAYKGGGLKTVDAYFTHVLLKGILDLAETVPQQEIVLTAIPPSKVGKYSPVRNSISMIMDWYEKGFLKDALKDRRLVDGQNVLFRRTDITTAHEEHRASYYQQWESLGCRFMGIRKDKSAFFILDDITTSGLSLNVCEDLMVDQGVSAKNTVKLAIAKTRSLPDKEGASEGKTS